MERPPGLVPGGLGLLRTAAFAINKEISTPYAGGVVLRLIGREP
jgi:hypothetical protein